MSLKDLWLSQKAEYSQKKVSQIISISGDGELKDNSTTANEFREFLGIVPSEILAKYSVQCLDKSFNNSGFVLQDLVNEIGSRLDFEVEFGRYKGIKGEIGYDGLWMLPNSKKIIIEVKTTDAYRIDLETVSKYRKQLIKEHNYNGEDITILYVVGREDTGGLESQVRGSRHAWDIRLISVDALIKLMRLKEELDDPTIVQQIHEILIPKEYTKLDEIADLLFFTAEEVKQSDEEPQIDTKQSKGAKTNKVDYRDYVIRRIEQHLGRLLKKKSFASYTSNNKLVSVVCAISREYGKANKKGYWFAFHPHQKTFLENSEKGFLALGCGSEKQVLLIPILEFIPYLTKMNTTTRENGKTYWHVQIGLDRGIYKLTLKKGFENQNLTQYLMQ